MDHFLISSLKNKKIYLKKFFGEKLSGCDTKKFITFSYISGKKEKRKFFLFQEKRESLKSLSYFRK